MKINKQQWKKEAKKAFAELFETKWKTILWVVAINLALQSYFICFFLTFSLLGLKNEDTFVLAILLAIVAFVGIHILAFYTTIKNRIKRNREFNSHELYKF